MAEQHPINPPLELVQEWASESLATQSLCNRAAQWGADQELEACIHRLITGPYGASIACHADHMIADLRAARRPKPPSLKEQALETLQRLSKDEFPCRFQEDADWDTIRRALEALPDA
jgi:hypothetical protein